MEEVLGIQATGAGFKTVDIRPDLIDLEWAKGGEPTPHGLLRVEARKDGARMRISVDVPDDVEARVSVPGGSVSVNGAAAMGVPAEGGARNIVTLHHAGHFELEGR
jgi:hypothetical protein